MTFRHRSARGFSLVEMLVSLVISAIVIAGAIGLMVGTQRHFQSTSEDRYLQETARVALGHLVNNLRMAGFGVDPSLAFDFGQMAGVRMDRAPGGATFSTTSLQGNNGACGSGLCRDRTDGPDEIVFLSRDASFGPHPLTVAANAASSSLVVAGNAAVQTGQILQVVCYTGSMTWAYVQASAASTYNAGTGLSTIPIASGTTTFPRQNGWLGDGCYGNVATVTGGILDTSTLVSAAEVFKVDRYRYYVASYDASGNIQPWGTANTRPFLMLDQGLTGASGAIRTPLVPDVEDLQFAYVYPYDTTTPLVGATPGTAIVNDDTGVNLAPGAGGPAYTDGDTWATRLNHHPGNIGAVRVSIVVRSSAADVTHQGDVTVPAAGNRAATAGAVGYQRLLVDTTIAVPNLGMRGPYYPTYGTYPAASGSRTINVGGG